MLEHTYGDSVGRGIDVLEICAALAGAQALFDRDPFEFECRAVSQIGGQSNEEQVGSRGIDGTIHFPMDSKGGKIGCVIVSVKGGKTVNPAMVWDLLRTVQQQQAEMGMLVTMDSLARGSQEVIDRSGSYMPQ